MLAYKWNYNNFFWEDSIKGYFSLFHLKYLTQLSLTNVLPELAKYE